MSDLNYTPRGLKMPADFPLLPYHDFYWKLWGLRFGQKDFNQQPRSWALDGWQGVAYRFRSCAEHYESYVESLDWHGNTIIEPERYLQERDLFGFFVDGLAVIECLSFSLFAISMFAEPDNFVVQTARDLKNINPKSVSVKLVKVFPKAEVSDLLRSVVALPEFREWSDTRNVLAHRVAPARLLHESAWIMEDVAEEGFKDKTISISNSSVKRKRQWIGETISCLLDATARFTTRCLDAD